MTTRSGRSYQPGIPSKEIKTKKVDYTEISETDGEDKNDFRISKPKKHFDFLTKGIPVKYLKSTNILYMQRTYVRSTKDDYYKLGFANYYNKRIKGLNCEYDACGRNNSYYVRKS
jgi:hypothetical protein